jgi:hypothetical protein
VSATTSSPFPPVLSDVGLAFLLTEQETALTDAIRAAFDLE